jgi:hypothetical protein
LLPPGLRLLKNRLTALHAREAHGLIAVCIDHKCSLFRGFSFFLFSLHFSVVFPLACYKNFLKAWHCFHCFVYVIQTYCLLVAVENKRRFPSPMVLTKLRRIHRMIFSSVTSCLRRRCAFSLITEPWYMCLPCYRVLSCKALAERFS